jgi:hypothetical protein
MAQWLFGSLHRHVSAMDVGAVEAIACNAMVAIDVVDGARSRHRLS